MTDWYSIWSRNREYLSEQMDLQYLIEANGFNSGAGKIHVEDWKNYVHYIYKLADLHPEDSVFEVGCGGGAFLYPLYQKGLQVGGIDYSPSLIKLAQYSMPDMPFEAKNADQMDVLPKYDAVIANSVFQYFPSLEYMTEIIYRMYEKANKTIVLMDLNDLAFREEALEIRRGSLSPGEYDRKYKGLDHLFIDRSAIQSIFEDLPVTVEVSDQNIHNYGNNKFRFNVVIKKW